MTYAERRAAAIALAAAYNGWARPPTPEGKPPARRMVIYGRRRWAFVPNTAALDAEQAARERRQDRIAFKK